MADQVSRSAARTAALIAVPVALLTALGLFLWINSALHPSPDLGPVDTVERRLSTEAVTACRAVLAGLPDELAGLPRRPVTAGPEQNAAYGDPPVTLECGVPEAEFPLTDVVYPLPGGDRACWHAAERADHTVWTTVDRVVPVRVTVPAEYDGPGQLVTSLSGAVAAAVAASDTEPSGCAG